MCDIAHACVVTLSSSSTAGHGLPYLGVITSMYHTLSQPLRPMRAFTSPPPCLFSLFLFLFFFLLLLLLLSPLSFSRASTIVQLILACPPWCVSHWFGDVDSRHPHLVSFTSSASMRQGRGAIRELQLRREIPRHGHDHQHAGDRKFRLLILVFYFLR